MAGNKRFTNAYTYKSKSAQSCPTLWDPMDCSLPGSSVHGIFQEGILERLVIPSPGDLPHPGIKPGSPELQADSVPSEPLGKPICCVCVCVCMYNKAVRGILFELL